MKNKSKNKKNNSAIDNNTFQTFFPEAELDYHLLGKLLPYDIEKYLIDFLEESFVNQLKQVMIITGKGQVVRPLVQRLLKQNKFVKNFKQAGYFNGQDGAWEVTLKNE